MSSDLMDSLEQCTHQWISFKDRLPEHNQFILGVGENKTMEVLRCDLHRNGDHVIDYVLMHPSLTHQVIGTTHWMQLPEPPEQAAPL